MNISNILGFTFRLQKKTRSDGAYQCDRDSTGLLSLFFVLAYYLNGKSYDTFHQHANDIYRVVYSRYNHGTMEYETANSFFPTGRYLKDNNQGVLAMNLAGNYRPCIVNWTNC